MNILDFFSDKILHYKFTTDNADILKHFEDVRFTSPVTTLSFLPLLSGELHIFVTVRNGTTKFTDTSTIQIINSSNEIIQENTEQLSAGKQHTKTFNIPVVAGEKITIKYILTDGTMYDHFYYETRILGDAILDATKFLIFE